MAIRFVCPQCGRAGRLPDEFPGGKIRCPQCKTISKVDGAVSGSKLTTESTPAEQAVSSSFRQPMPGGDTYEVEMEEPRPAIETPPRTPVVPPIPKEARKPSRKSEKLSGRQIVLIGGTAVAGAVVAAGFAVFLLRPSGVAERPAAEQVRAGGAEDTRAQGPSSVPQPAVTMAPITDEIANVADRQGNPGDTQPGTSRPSPAGAAPESGRQGLQTNVRMSDSTPTAKVGLAPGESLAKVITPDHADRGPSPAADPIKRVQEATVFLKVQAGRTRGSGTGFVIQSEGNTVLIATNDHVANPHLKGVSRDDDSPRAQPQPTIVAVFRSGSGPGS